METGGASFKQCKLRAQRIQQSTHLISGCLSQSLGCGLHKSIRETPDAQHIL